MDYTGKAGAGKRYLDANGNFIPITKLPKSVQEEIARNSAKANSIAMSKRVSKGQVDDAVNATSDKLLSIIEKQSEVIERLEAKLSGMEDKVDSLPKPKLSPKQELQKQCDELGIAYSEKDTIRQLEKMIQEETMEVIAEDDERFEENEENQM